MKLKSLETKCPICGTKNVPLSFTAEIDGNEKKVKAEYYCAGKVRWILRRAKPCQTQYRIVLRNDAAEQVLSEICLTGMTSCGTEEDKEG